MKYLSAFFKIILTLFGVLLFGLIVVGSLNFALQPSEPEAVTKIVDDVEIVSEFHSINTDSWNKEGGKLIFSNNTPTKEKITLKTSLLPSEKKKEGYVTSSVKISSDFKTIPDDAILGFQIGEEDSDPNNQIIMGVNGKGELVVLDGAMNVLTEEEIKEGNLLMDCSEDLELSFRYVKNPYGWLTYFVAKNDKSSCSSSVRVNKIPTDKLNDANKEISLFVYNPSQSGKLWFEEWKVWNDWTPND